eukprot:gb/GEZN01004089.1/.p1 GENE.gb/GEZN01004089.1/~~gb/GEZN01004089.1/.p1  ORF type:complete len:608 (-),score=97.22 gb/GEZN01004089.1/:207-1772(-)
MGIFGSSDFNIIGPAGALSGMLKGYCIKWGSDILPWIAIFSSVVVMAVRVFKLQGYMLIMPKSVFEGFTMAVAVLIGMGQLNNAFGLKPAVKHEKFILNMWESIKLLPEATIDSMALFFPLFLIMFFACKYVPKIPWMTVLPVATIALGYMSEKEIIGWTLPTLKTKYGELDTKDVFQLPKMSVLKDVGAEGAPELAAAVFSVAFVAVLETLISAKIGAYKMGIDFDESVETFGLSFSHLLCGLLGGMPCTGVFVRTSINMDLGATHRLAQFMNACFVLLVTIAAMPIMTYLPMPSIAAVLMVASCRMAPLHFLAELWRQDKGSFWLCVVVALLCVVEDPVIGLIIGTLLALLRTAERVNAAPKAVEYNLATTDSQNNTLVVQIKGPLTFENAETVTRKCISLMHPGHTIVLDLSHMTYVDYDGLEQLLKLSHVDKPSGKQAILVQEHVRAQPYPLSELKQQLGDRGAVDRVNNRRDRQEEATPDLGRGASGSGGMTSFGVASERETQRALKAPLLGADKP